jgi:murein DD-endopeptidase MepM/ murein hydrolase activator NlpD
LKRELYALSRRADSIEQDLHRKNIYFNNMKLIIEGYDLNSDSLTQHDIYTPLPTFNIDTIELHKSIQDSALRAEFEKENMYNLSDPGDLVKTVQYKEAAKFFTPITGSVVLPYDPANGHYGIDIASTENQVIKATLDGTVVYSSWTLDFGYTIGIQHDNNYFSTYKHNATLLKKEGDYVRAGEAIAIVGESGEKVTGQHLHFELWHNGMSVNPSDYINFEKGEGS